jgi:hypothetical protein
VSQVLSGVTTLQDGVAKDMWWYLKGPRVWDRRVRLGLIFGLFLMAFIGLLLAPRVPLGIRYHDFADKRTLLGIPNCLDVLSNIPFVIAGLLGVWWTLRKSSGPSFLVNAERLPYAVFFAGVALTGIGSFWYHLAPGNARLPWDLLPMTVSFMSVVAATVIERIDGRAGFWLYGPLLFLGAASVAYWYITESQGRGDYRFYLFVQFFSPVILAAIVWLFPPRYTGTGYLAFAFLLFVLAKAMEVLDGQIYAATGYVSGHALKHLTAAVACFWILLMLWRRRPLADLLETDLTPTRSEYASDYLRS